MALTSGTRVGSYQIVGAIGSGGMGEVYRARDPKLGRDVALKILPATVAEEPERLTRFQREAQVLASLNHPNIAAIYHVEEADGAPAIVMELVEGETLADRIARGAIPIDEALPIARQIAEALEAAHEQGIIHRDLKPANIKVRPDGTIKVLDFGLAKLAESTAVSNTPAAALSISPTITSPALVSGVGVLLGTAAYMSPEQAKGRQADKRSDIWAFGCVLYEMLTGTRPFGGDDVPETLASVLAREPDWTTLPNAVAPAIRMLLRRCLEKDPRQRVRDIAAALVLLEESSALHAVSPADVQRQIDAEAEAFRRKIGRSTRRRMVAVIGVTLLVGSGLAATAVWLALRPTPPRAVQLTIATTPATALNISGADRDVAITADGSTVIYAGNSGTELFARPLDALEPVSLYKGTPRVPFASPDGQWVGLIDNINTMRKVAITGGPAVTLATLDGSGSRGAVWLPGDTIVFASANSATGLQQLSANGGQVTVLTRPDRARGEADHVWPEALPGGRAVLFTIVPTTGGVDAAQVAVLDLQTRTYKVVVRGGSHAHYVATGHLLYAAGGTLRAVGFDPAALTTVGTVAPVISDVVMTGAAPGGGVDAAIADDGTLVYVRGVGIGAVPRALVWIDRQGRETPVPAPSHTYMYPRVSADGRKLLVWAVDQANDLWVWDVPRLALTRLTFAPEQDLYPVWSADGRRVFFSSERDGPRNLFQQAADGTGMAERLTTSMNPQNATAVTPDGTRLLFTETFPETREDVMQVSLAGAHAATPLVQSAAAERNGTVSPDGRWLAYEANDSGQFEIYVRPYPDVASGRWQVSTRGGVRPLWSRDGRELFYVSTSNALMRVGVEHAASWSASTPTVLLKDGSVVNPGNNLGRNYDISADGQRFVVVRTMDGANSPPPQLVVVQHFDQILKRVVAIP